MSQTTVLAIDTATENCSVALSHGDKIFYKGQVAPQKHASLVLGMIDDLLRENGVERSDIDCVAFGSGPGSFTGVRISVSAAQALALGLDVKVFGVSDLKLLTVKQMVAQGTMEHPCYGLSCIDARMGEVYLALYRYDGNNLSTVLAEQVIRPEAALDLIARELSKVEAGAVTVTGGTGMAILKEAAAARPDLSLPDLSTEETHLYPEADAIIMCSRLGDMNLTDPALAEPLYCRNEVTWKKIGEQ